MLLTIISAFLGYVLPWGQISFWGATVIINLLRILPKGKFLVIWLWGGFYVSSFTCRFFYALHFLTPFIVLILVAFHLFLLHYSGSSVPGGIRRSNVLKVKFVHLFLYKDVVNFTLFWGIWIWALIYPDWSADPVNFVISDLSNSPLHIQPEWYFLHLYAILRSIPNKLGGLIGFALALILLASVIFVFQHISFSQWQWYNFISWRFILINLVLIWLGIQPVEEPFIFIGQVRGSLYFLYIFLVVCRDYLLNVLFN